MERHIAIIGSGFSGLCLGIQLKQAGLDSFTIFEKSDRIGGTWRENRYPGSCCDLPSMAYCFSFEQKMDWSRKWSPAPEILAYLEHCVAKYRLGPHLRLNTEIAHARFDGEAGVWHLRTGGGEEDAGVVVAHVGQVVAERGGEDPSAGDVGHVSTRGGVEARAVDVLQHDPQGLVDPDPLLGDRHVQQARALVLGHPVCQSIIQPFVERLRVGNDRPSQQLAPLRPRLQLSGDGLELGDSPDQALPAGGGRRHASVGDG